MSEHEEYQYLHLLKKILTHGKVKTNTLSIFGAQMRFDLSNNIIPVLTTKRIFWRAVVEELLWFISGSTNANVLSAKGIHIWDANGDRKYQSKRSLFRDQGDLGPSYGFQWRHFGAKYKTMNDDYTGQGVDQLMNCINLIKNDPSSRRIIMTAWDPCSVDETVLPPCHCFVQFYVNDGILSTHLYQRSGDMGLGVPFNIASYSLLTHIIAQITDLKPGEFIHTLGDAHIYTEHIESLNIMIKRDPFPFPTIKILSKSLDLTAADIILNEYKHHDPLPMKLIT